MAKRKREKRINKTPKTKNKLAVFHYLSLHKSEFYGNKHDGRELPNSDYYTDCLVRLPFYYELSFSELTNIISIIKKYLRKL